MKSLLLEKIIAAILLFNAIVNGNPTNITTTAADDELIILGGACAKEGEFPYLIRLFADTSLCSGSIISKSYILTAKHCVQGYNSESIYISAGSLLSSEINIIRRAIEVNMHPSEDQDIAIVRLNEELTFNSKIQSIKMSSAEVPENATITIAGWGLIEDHGGFSKCLKSNIVTALSTSECAEEYPKYKDFLCLRHAKNNGACNGDSGGPAVYKNKLVGVANRVFGGCGSTLPDGYAKIRPNIKWILENTK